MSTQLLFFGATANIAGHRTVEVPELVGLSAEHALDTIVKKFPPLSSHKLHFSINHEFASAHDVIRDGDELAVFTPVSGG